jgi:uncharacterized circularly permuted ATP-grasp superfamily protein
VWLKSIDGLQKVDVIIRRIDDDWCDPLELHGGSSLGVPGLLQAIRMGNVQVLNPPGHGRAGKPCFSGIYGEIYVSIFWVKSC